MLVGLWFESGEHVKGCGSRQNYVRVAGESKLLVDGVAVVGFRALNTYII